MNENQGAGLGDIAVGTKDLEGDGGGAIRGVGKRHREF